MRERETGCLMARRHIQPSEHGRTGLLDLERLMARRRRLEFGQLLDEHSLAIRQLGRRPHLDDDKEVALSFLSDLGHAFPIQPKRRATLSSGWNRDMKRLSSQPRHPQLSAERRIRKGNRLNHIEIVAVTLERRMAPDMRTDEKIAWWPAVGVRLTLARQPNEHAVVDSR